MPIIAPTWTDLQDLVRAARAELWLCSPYITDEGLTKVFDVLGDTPHIRIWTRLSPSDWVAGASDPESLRAFMEILVDDGRTVDLGILQRLHAKLYASDRRTVLIGSANLTDGGFSRNVELMVRLEDEDARSAVTLLEDASQPYIRPVRLPQLAEWIERANPIIREAARSHEVEPAVVAPVQADLDRMLGFGRGAGIQGLPDPTLEDLERFANWLHTNADLAGADILYRRYTNADGQNLTGHVRQSFAAACRFLTEYEELRPVLSTALCRMAPDEIYDMDDPAVSEAWLNHFDQHATDVGDDYDYSILRSYLPPSLGGTRLGGGGGSSTFKRVLPLVARYLLQ